MPVSPPAPRWILKPPASNAEIGPLASALQVPQWLASLLIQRNVKSPQEADAYFDPRLEHMHDPLLMKDMDVAVKRIVRAVQQGEKVLVYGDYDVDGTTAVAMMSHFLISLGLPVEYYIPDRHTEGYGFSAKGVEFALQHGFGLIITLDCGIKDTHNVAACRHAGIDVVVCDHHLPAVLPPALAVLDPKRSDCSYPYKELSGCGVGLKLIQALCSALQLEASHWIQYLDLATISIGADIVPITGENRVIAYHGMAALNMARRPGIDAMLKTAKFEKPQLEISDVVFILAPRINAAGRIQHGRAAVELLLAGEVEAATQMSAFLEESNLTRRELDREITQEALQLIEADDFYRHSFGTVVMSESWHKGVIGIVASRLVEQYYKPTIVLMNKDGRLAGSARSIDGIDMYEVLSECDELLEQFGGHTMAAGLTMPIENFRAFRQRFDEVVAQRLNHQRPHPQLWIDAEINLSDITRENFNLVSRIAPFGPENMRPVFLTRSVVNAGTTRQVGNKEGHENKHLKLHARQSHDSASVSGIAFGLGHLYTELAQGKAFDIVYTLEENVWRDTRTIQLQVRDMRPAGEPVS